jgi:hypothetical protein
VTFFTEPSAQNAYLETHVALLRHSFWHFTGRDLIRQSRTDRETAQALFYAPFAVVSHDTAEDPVFNYANRVALKLFEMSWKEFTTLPSRQSAEPQNRSERTILLKAVSAKGFIDNYSGIRISKTGKRFLISKVIVWNLMDEKTHHYRGQAAMFPRWTFLANAVD